ncbi:hypothetical protein DD582_19330 [Klebsiella pneumoniae]|nr:hypothetical protein DD582_19330 [Klebsiella pneumoniae]
MYTRRLSRCRHGGLTCSFLRLEIHRACTGKDCNPQPANCLKDHNVLRHCCVGDRSDKIGHSANVLF